MSALRKILQFLLIFVVSVLSTAQISLAVPFALSKGELNAQAHESFEAKFAIVTPDIKATSDANLLWLESAVGAQSGSSTYLESARKTLPSFMARLAYSHASTVSGAIQILKSGSIFSLDELVRRNLVPVETKQGRFTKASSDGIIGEQDVVFVAIRDRKDIQTSQFGPVSFVFNGEALLTRGYFSPYAYAVGLTLSPSEAADLKGAVEENRQYARFYRPFLFQGLSALERFLTLSIAGNSRYQQEIFPEFRPKFQTWLENNRASLTPEFLDATNSLVKKLGQGVQYSALREIDDQNVINFVSDGSWQSPHFYGDLYPVFNAYRGFPVQLAGDSPLVRTQTFEFLELKVPREIPLSAMRAVVFPRKIWVGQCDDQAHQCRQVQVDVDVKSIEEAINAYAVSAKRSYEQIVHETWFEYRFGQY